MAEPGDAVITLVVDGGGGDQEVRLFADWMDGKRAFKTALSEFKGVTFDVDHRRSHWWAGPAEGPSTPWVELKKVRVE